MLTLSPHRLLSSSPFRLTPDFFFNRARRFTGLRCAEETNVLLRSPDLVASEYAELNISYKPYEDVGHVRIRQHVNPLSSSFRVPAEAPDWKGAFEDATLPLMVDIGCGNFRDACSSIEPLLKVDQWQPCLIELHSDPQARLMKEYSSGRFLLWLAKRNSSSKNYLGLEIRQKLVCRANIWVKELGLGNAHFLFANATVSFQNLVASYPGPVEMVSILCPDPHFKRKHHKRRVVQRTLVDSIVNNLAPGGQVFVQSDVLDVALDMRSQLDAFSGVLQPINTVDRTAPCDSEGWLLHNPMGIRTEREIHAEHEGSKIYRRVYQKCP